MTRPWRSDVVALRISSTISASVSARDGMAPVKRIAAERAEAHPARLGPLAGHERHALVIDHDERAVALDDRALLGEIERHDRDVLALDIFPDVELGPVREREDAHAFARGDAAVIDVPQFRPLVLRVPAVLGAAHRKDALLGAALLLVAARAAEGGIEAAGVERLLAMRPSS